jgi:hypothetical protein
MKNLRQANDNGGAARSSSHQVQDTFNRADDHKSPHEILVASGSMEAVRIRNVKNLLVDFFGL